MQSKFSWVIAVFVIMAIGLWWGLSRTGNVIFSPKSDEVSRAKPYEKYGFDKLSERGGVASKIQVVGSKFYYTSEGRRISGEINQAQGEMKGIVVMARGYVEKEIYKTGIGTHNAAKYYSENGYTTYAPDFSGYGESDAEDENALGARLVKPVEILDLIASIEAKSKAPIYLWGHSNGGQIMLSVAEILGIREPSLQGDSSQVRGVTLWAPVSKPFPYNILYYTDDATDSGKWLRGQVAEFEHDYDVFNYSVDRYLDSIMIPIQLHQGSADPAVPKAWSDALAKTLKEKNKMVNYYVYPGADHNLKPGWDMVVSRDVEWFETLK